MTGVGVQLGLLFWKNWLLQKRKVVVTIFEILLPLLFAAFLLVMRSFVSYDSYPDPTLFEPFQVSRFSRTLIPPTTTMNSTPPLYWKMMYSPNTTLTNAIAERMVANLQPGQASIIRVGSAVGFPTEDEMVEFFRRQNFSTSDYLAGVAFHDIDGGDTDLPTNISYSIRLNSSPRNSPEGIVASIQWPTDFLFPFYQFPIPREKNESDGGFPGEVRIMNSWAAPNISSVTGSSYYYFRRSRNEETKKIQEKETKKIDVHCYYSRKVSSVRMRDERQTPLEIAKKCISNNKDQEGKFEVKQTESKGRGVFAKENIPSGNFLLHYPGELIPRTDVEERERSSRSVYRYFFPFKGSQLCLCHKAYDCLVIEDGRKDSLD